MSKKMLQRVLQAGVVVTALAVLVTTGLNAVTGQPSSNLPKSAKVVPIKESELQSAFEGRFNRKLALGGQNDQDLGLAINTWLGYNGYPGCAGFWIGELNRDAGTGQITRQVCVVKLD